MMWVKELYLDRALPVVRPDATWGVGEVSLLDSSSGISTMRFRTITWLPALEEEEFGGCSDHRGCCRNVNNFIYNRITVYLTSSNCCFLAVLGFLAEGTIAWPWLPPWLSMSETSLLWSLAPSTSLANSSVSGSVTELSVSNAEPKRLIAR